MMKPAIIKLLYGLFLGTILLYTCSSNPMSGTISEENTGTVHGHVWYPNLQPAQNSSVIINRIDGYTDDSPLIVRTDLNGYFNVNHLELGRYTVASIQMYTGALERISLNPSDTVINVDLSLHTLGSIHGVIDTSIIDAAKSATVYLPEIDRSATVSGKGEFVLEDIAASSYTVVVLTGNDTVWNSSTAATEVQVTVGKKTYLTLPENRILHDDTSTLLPHPLLQCPELNPKSIVLEWHLFPNITDVRLMRGSTNNVADTVILADSDTVFTDATVVPNSTYYYCITMVDRFTDHRIRSPLYSISTPSADNENRSPMIALSAPERDTAVVRGNGFSITADAMDSDGSIREVLFLVDSSVIKTVETAPYQFEWFGSEIKRYAITAGAIDNDNDTTWSGTISLFVDSLLRGDVNDDGVISLIDAEYISRYYVDLPVSNFNAEVADVNGDAAITIVDALVLAQLLNGSLSLIPWYESGNATGF
jgi:hypothetical protein